MRGACSLAALRVILSEKGTLNKSASIADDVELGRDLVVVQVETDLVARQAEGQDEERWKEVCFLKFAEFMGLPTIEGFEDEILDFVTKISARRNKGKGPQGMSKFV